jgi:hypothetical protein
VLGAIDLPGTRVSSRILRARSAGIRDLRHGDVVDEDWLGRDPDALGGAPGAGAVGRPRGGRGDGATALLDDVAYYFLSATVTEDPDHPLGRLVGDLLVRVPSADGPVVSEGTFRIETRTFGGVLHHELQNHPDVYEAVRAICAGG